LLKPHIKVVDEFLNHLLIPNSVGKAFVDLYYTYSLPMADLIAKHDTLRLVVRRSLLPVIGISCVALQLGPWVTLTLLVLGVGLMGAGAGVALRRIRIRRRA